MASITTSVFSEADRRENLRRAAEVVKVMVEAGLIVIASFSSRFRAERQMVARDHRRQHSAGCMSRRASRLARSASERLYKRARAGHIPQFYRHQFTVRAAGESGCAFRHHRVFGGRVRRVRCATISPTGVCCAACAATIAWPVRQPLARGNIRIQ